MDETNANLCINALHLTSWRAKTQTEQELSWMLVCVCMGASGCMHSPTFVCMCVCAWEWGGALSVLGYVCLFKAVFAFQGCCCSVIKRRSTKGERREKRGKAIILQRQLFVS